MKKFRYLLSALALTLVFAGATKAIPVAAAAGPSVDYEQEVVRISDDLYDGTPYYQVVKAKDVATVKANAWLPVTAKSGDYFLIDISTFTKTGFVAITNDPTATAKEKFTVIEVSAPVKSLKVTLDFKTDVPKNLYDALAYAYAVNVDPAINATYNLDSADSTKKDRLIDFLDTYTLAWKRGANGTWISAAQKNVDTADADFQTTYTMLRASNGTLYVRVVAARVGEADKAAVLPSKEVKIKVAKTAAAPVLKINYKAGTVPIKNGMEFVFGGKTYYVPVYDKNSENTVKVTETANTTTKTKVTNLTIAEIQDVTKVAAGIGYTLQYRTTATAKKYASWYGEIALKAPLAAPAPVAEKTLGFNVNQAEKTIKLDFANLAAVEGRTLEYALSGADVDPATLKFTALGEAKDVDLSKYYGKEISYKKADKSTAKVKYEAATLYFRFAAVEDKADPSKNVFPSAVATLAPTTVAAVKLTFTVVGGTDKVKVTTVDGKEVKSPADVAKGAEYKFKLTVDEGYVLKTVKNGDATLTAVSDVYTVTPAADTTITITIEAKPAE